MKTIENLPSKDKRILRSCHEPFDDKTEDGLIRGGGRLQASDLSFGRKHPVLIPDTELGDALIGYIHHDASAHQGRKVNAAVFRERGYSIVGGRRRLQRIISSCILCRILRAPCMTQKMADLPEQRLWRTPPFLHCVIDVFGHFIIKRGRNTRSNPGTRMSGFC